MHHLSLEEKIPITLITTTCLMKRKQSLIAVFILLLIAHLLCIYSELELWRAVTKLLLVPLLITYLLLSQDKFNWKIKPVYALFFSFLGDALLIGKGPVFFLSGMISFVMAHLNYSYYFIQLNPVQKSTKQLFILPLILMLVFSATVYTFLENYLGAYQLPVVFYMLFISLMASLAIHTFSNPTIKQIAIKYFAPGAILFVLSDAILALNLFRFHEPLLDLAVMLTYGLAQCLLTIGFTKTSAIVVSPEN